MVEVGKKRKIKRRGTDRDKWESSYDICLAEIIDAAWEKRNITTSWDLSGHARALLYLSIVWTRYIAKSDMYMGAGDARKLWGALEPRTKYGKPRCWNDGAMSGSLSCLKKAKLVKFGWVGRRRTWTHCFSDAQIAKIKLEGCGEVAAKFKEASSTSLDNDPSLVECANALLQCK